MWITFEQKPPCSFQTIVTALIFDSDRETIYQENTQELPFQFIVLLEKLLLPINKLEKKFT